MDGLEARLHLTAAVPAVQATDLVSLPGVVQTMQAAGVLSRSAPPVPQRVPLSAPPGVPALDTQPPTAPTKLTLVTQVENGATIEWGRSTDNLGVVSYSIFRGATKVGSVPADTTVYTDAGVPTGITYAYTVRALDAAGNISAPSNSLSVTIEPAPTIAGNWALSFDDDFNTLNTKVWSNRYWWNSNAGTQATFDPKQVSVSNGILSLTAIAKAEKATTGVTNPYTSGLISTAGIQGISPPSFSFTYGYVEIRTQIAPGQGMWSALWMLPADYTADYELDVIEILGRAPTVDQGFYHVGSNLAEAVSVDTGVDLTKGYHTYGVDWEPNSITWYMDGQVMGSYTNAADIVNKPMTLMLNLDVGGDWAGPLTSASPAQSSWLVDDVRVWQHIS